MVLSDKEHVLIETVRRLPDESKERLLGWVEALRSLAEETKFDWSDEWSDDDIADLNRAAHSRFYERENRD